MTIDVHYIECTAVMCSKSEIDAAERAVAQPAKPTADLPNPLKLLIKDGHGYQLPVASSSYTLLKADCSRLVQLGALVPTTRHIVAFASFLLRFVGCSQAGRGGRAFTLPSLTSCAVADLTARCPLCSFWITSAIWSATQAKCGRGALARTANRIHGLGCCATRFSL